MDVLQQYTEMEKPKNKAVYLILKFGTKQYMEIWH